MKGALAFLLLVALVKETKEEALFGHFQDPKTIDAFYCLSH